MAVFLRKSVSRRRNRKRILLRAKKSRTAAGTGKKIPENELRIEFGSLLFNMVRYDLIDEIAAELSHAFDVFVECGFMERPIVRLMEDEGQDTKSYAIYLLGEQVYFRGFAQHDDAHKELFRCLRKDVEIAIFSIFREIRLPESFIRMKEQEDSREACLFLYWYFREVEDDRQQSFHWLKKLAAFGVPEDLQMLSRAYDRGDGCREDPFLADKYDIAAGGIVRNRRSLF